MDWIAGGERSIAAQRLQLRPFEGMPAMKEKETLFIRGYKRANRQHCLIGKPCLYGDVAWVDVGGSARTLRG